MEREDDSFQSDCACAAGWLTLSEKRAMIPRDAVMGILDSLCLLGCFPGLLDWDVDVLFILGFGFEFPVGLKISNSQILAGGSVFEGFDFDGNGHESVLQRGIHHFASINHWARSHGSGE
jgi:hypothetical protein